MIWSAVILGLFGSIHCLAMCGPLVLTLNAGNHQTLLDKFLYNGGRIFTYCLLGLAAGIFGSGVEWAAGQQFLSVFTGILLLAGLLISWLAPGNSYKPAGRLVARMKIKLTEALKGHPRNKWWFGMYNGLLPCGLTYLALAAAIALGSVPKAILYMALFGLGTSPMMWFIVSGIQRLKPQWVSGNRLVTGFTWILAVLLIVRGMGLGVPYLSPDLKSPHSHESHMPVIN
ncbi:MAG: membrane protein [Cyclobacteriaceae bacterium]|nr:MAG: membrane protein [Cyclobacteriaceae bacterium]